MHKTRAISIAVAITFLLAAPAFAFHKFLFAALSGFNEVPAVLSPASGSFKAVLRDDDTIDYRLQYQDTLGVPLQAHIHFGQKDVNGGVVAFLCGGSSAPGCGPNGASGTLDASSVVSGASAQGIDAGDFEGLVTAIQTGNAYVNVHTTVFPNGEIRGQIR
jgi:hypothetical protein